MLTKVEINGFKSFAKKTDLLFSSRIVGIVGPNGSGKSNVAEAFRFVLGEQSMKTMRGSKGEDMIWSGSSQIPRANRASVSVTFNNRSRSFNLDADEITIERIVFRDGKNEYRVNKSVSRLKDIHEMLSEVHIGSSRHHIISQGEADRILNANPMERAEILADSLGLTALELKKEESEQKLLKTIEHQKEVELQRRETLPRLTYLRKQIEKKEKSDSIKRELQSLLVEYVDTESTYIKIESERLLQESKEPRESLRDLELQADKIRSEMTLKGTTPSATVSNTKEEHSLRKKIEGIDMEIRTLYSKRAALEYATQRSTSHEVQSVRVPASDIQQLGSFAENEEKKARVDNNFSLHLGQLVSHIRGFVNKTTEKNAPEISPEQIKKDIDLIQTQISIFDEQKQSLQFQLKQFTTKPVSHEILSIERERDLLKLTALISDLRARIKELDYAATLIQNKKNTLEHFKDECHDFIVPGKIKNESPIHYEQSKQDDLKMKIVRMKIRYEELGSIGQDTLKEYEEVNSRDQFLQREIVDIEKARESLSTIIDSLARELQVTFEQGIKSVNKEFTKFFSILFNGGDASLVETKEVKRRKTVSLDDPKEMPQRGIDVSIHLPRKRVSSLSILSGGERALTSIALIFAMSHINPPPFIILDETDAALDEANSSKYAEIIQALADQSQLIVITHNRATMSAAGTLFGITMNNDGVSQLLSVKLEEALRVAK